MNAILMISLYYVSGISMDFVKFIDQLSKRNEWNEREKHIENPEPINRKTIEELIGRLY